MKSLTKLIISLAVMVLVGSTIISTDYVLTEEPVPAEETVPVNEETNPVSTSAIQYINRGEMRASWYGPGFHGKLTANGEIYDQMAFTAAHKTLKFGTLLKLTNTKNDKSVVVRINDRGPYIPGRQLDLSKAAALELGMMKPGVVRLQVEEIQLTGLSSPIVSLN